MRVTFIVTIREHAETLGICLHSVLAAAMPGDEILLVDECSRDESPMIIASAPGQLRRDHPLHGRIALSGPEMPTGAALPDAILWRPIRLGTRPDGGRGVGVNAGLSMATRDAVVILTGQDRLEPSGVCAARAELGKSGADIVLGRFSGAHCDEENRLWQRHHDNPDTVLAMEAQAARMMVRRAFMQAEGLRFAEGAFALAEPVFHWRACLRARRIRLLDRIMTHGPARPAEAGQSAESLSAVFAQYQDILTLLGTDGPHAALRDWLARMVGRHLAALAPADYWTYAEAADPAVLAGEWPEGRGGRALEALSKRALWQAVALWQAEAILTAPEADKGGAGHKPGDCPHRHATESAIALWRGLRAGTPAVAHEGPATFRA